MIPSQLSLDNNIKLYCFLVNSSLALAVVFQVSMQGSNLSQRNYILIIELYLNIVTKVTLTIIKNSFEFQYGWAKGFRFSFPLDKEDTFIQSNSLSTISMDFTVSFGSSPSIRFIPFATV